MGTTNACEFIKHEVMRLGIPDIKKITVYLAYYITEVFPCTLQSTRLTIKKGYQCITKQYMLHKYSATAFNQGFYRTLAITLDCQGKEEKKKTRKKTCWQEAQKYPGQEESTLIVSPRTFNDPVIQKWEKNCGFIKHIYDNMQRDTTLIFPR